MPGNDTQASRVQRIDVGDRDHPVRLTSPRDWIVLIIVLAIVVGGSVWGVTASLPRSVTAVGLITYPDGAFVVQTAASGTITDVAVKPGDRVRPGAPVATVDRGTGPTVVRSPVAGLVFAVPARVGEVVTPGDVVMSAERATAAAAPVAVIFLPPTVPATLDVGAPVQLTVPAAPPQQFGVLLGRVRSVDPRLSTRQEVAAFVGDDDLAAEISGPGGARRVVVALDGARNPSGYRWSIGQGPPFPITSRTLVSGNLPQPPLRPIEWLIAR